MLGHARGKRRPQERGTKKMGYMKYLKLMNRMNAVTQVPQPPVPQFEKYCKLFVTDEEYDIMMGMKLRGNTEAELRALYTGSDWAGTLYDMCRKGFLLKIYDGAEPTYDLAPMLPGWFEFPLSTGEDSDTIQKASELFTSAINMVTTLNVEPLRTGYAAMNNLKKLQGDKGHMEVALPLEGKAAGKVVHVDRKLSNDTTSVVPSYQLEAYLDSLPDDAPISVMHCFCRNIRRREGMQPKHPTPDEVCLCVGNMAKQIIEFGIGRQVSKAEARRILVDCENKGCVHQVFHYACNMDEETTAICNCDTQCCEMLGSYTRGGMQPLYMRAHAKPVIVHPENCNGCNICNHFCPTVATGFNAQSGKVFVEYQRCIGCGVCVTKCPKDVRKMVDGDRVLFCKPLKKDLVRERNVRRQPKKKQMHEAAIAKEVFDIAQQAMAENGLTRLTRVVMDIGEYSAVVPEQLQLVFRIAVHNTAMDGCALEIHDLPGELGMYVRTIEGE